MPMSSRWLRNSFIYLLILVAVVAIVVSFFRSGSDSKSMDFSQVVNSAAKGEIKSIEISGKTLKVVRNDEPDTTYKSRIGDNTDVEQVLKDNGASIGGTADNSVQIKYKNP